MAERQRFSLLLRHRVAMVRQHFLLARQPYPGIRDALHQLQGALDAELPPPVVRRGSLKRTRGSGGAATGATASAATGAGSPVGGVEPHVARERKCYHQARRLRKERDALALQLRRMSGAKEGGQLSQEWLLRIFLAKPNASARFVEQSFGDIVGSDVTTVSRFSLNRVRDAWVEMYKPMVLTVGAGLVAQCAALALGDEEGEPLSGQPPARDVLQPPERDELQPPAPRARKLLPQPKWKQQPATTDVRVATGQTVPGFQRLQSEVAANATPIRFFPLDAAPPPPPVEQQQQRQCWASMGYTADEWHDFFAKRGEGR